VDGDRVFVMSSSSATAAPSRADLQQ